MNFRDFAVERGFDLDLHHLDGTLHRFKRNNKPKDNGWCIGWRHDGGFIIARFGDWSEGIEYRFKSHDIMPQEVQKGLKIKQIEYNQEKRKRQVRAAAQAVRTIDDALEISSNHPYITRKQIKPQHVIGDKSNNILVPMIINDRVVGIQKISPDGLKKFMTGQEVSGACHIISSQKSGRIYICEGWATGQTINMATGGTVVCAFTAANLKNVAQEFRKRHPRREIIICADNDQFTDGNPGIEFAKKAAKAVGGWVVYPQFQYLRGKPTDFNDLMVQEGIETVKDNILYYKKETPKKDGQTTSGKMKALRLLTDLVNNKPDNQPVFEQTIHCVCGSRKPIEECEQEIVRYLEDEDFASYITRFTDENHSVKLLDGFDPVKVDSFIKHWKRVTKPIAEPISIRELSDPGLCFYRLPWDSVAGPMPRFEEFLKRCDNAKALCAWIGSLFYAKADIQQYVYLYGDGLNGKGSLIRFLMRCIGPGFASMEPPGRDNRFWNYGLLGKRLVVFPDCNDADFVTSQRFKMISGGDPIPMEQKGKDSFTSSVNCKFLFASNVKPGITGQKSDMRRAIYVKVDPIVGRLDTTYEDSLWLEARHIIHLCKAVYREVCPTDGDIETDETGIDQLVEENSETYRSIFNEYFNYDQKYFDDLKNGESPPKNKAKRFTGTGLGKLLSRELKLNKSEYTKFKEYMRICLGIQYKKISIDGEKKGPYYLGASFKRSGYDSDEIGIEYHANLNEGDS